MKKVIVAVVMIAVIMSHTPLAAQVEAQVPPVVTAAFAHSVVQATHAAWRKCSDAVFLVTYRADEEYFLTYMNNQGTVLTTARKVSLEHSPMLLQQSIAGFQASSEKKYGAMAVTHVYEVVSEGVTGYYINLGNNAMLLSFIADANGNIGRITKTRNALETAPYHKLLAKN